MVKNAKVLLRWQAPVRPFKQRNREFWSTTAAILALASLILFFAQEWLLIIVILSFVFLYYVLSSNQPQKMEYKITAKGIKIPDVPEIIDWKWLVGYWFSNKWDHELINLKTKLANPPIIQMVIPKNKKKAAADILKKRLPLLSPEKNILDNIASWISKNLPLEN